MTVKDPQALLYVPNRCVGAQSIGNKRRDLINKNPSFRVEKTNYIWSQLNVLGLGLVNPWRDLITRRL